MTRASCCRSARLGRYAARKAEGWRLPPACKICKLCVRNGPRGVFEYRDDFLSPVDKAGWQGIAVYVEHHAGVIHPVTFELLGKARELAKIVDQPVYAVFIGAEGEGQAEELRYYGVDGVFLYSSPALHPFPHRAPTRRRWKISCAWCARAPCWWAAPPSGVRWRRAWRRACAPG